MADKTRVCITVDVEQDCPPFRDTYHGIERGMPLLTELLAREGIGATFFTTGDVARRYAPIIEALVGRGHELACHGDTHRRFDQLGVEEAELELHSATQTLREMGNVTSFRAPNLAFPNCYLSLLEKFGYRLDSSQGKHKLDYWTRPASTQLRRVPASTTSSVIRIPAILRNRLLAILRDPIVLFVHPWEFVDWRRSTLRWDCRFRTGTGALECLRTTIDYFRGRDARFLKMRDLEPMTDETTDASLA